MKQPEDGHYQAPKHVVESYIENTLYSTNKYSCVRPVHTTYIGYFIERNGDDEPYDWGSSKRKHLKYSTDVLIIKIQK